MAETTTPSVKKYYDYAQQQIDEQVILDKFNAATTAQFNAQREANRQAENQFYNQMYNTQKTAMDTIRQSNAAAVASGASRGVQAAQELSSLLGLQEESVASATELAQANRQTAQEETAAVLENVLNAYTQAQQERAQLVSQGIESASVDVQNEANKIAAQEAAARQQEADAETKRIQLERNKYLMDLKLNDINKYNQEIAKDNAAADFTNMTEAQLVNNITTANTALNEAIQSIQIDYHAFGGNLIAPEKAYDTLKTSLRTLYSAYGLDIAEVDNIVSNLKKIQDTINNQEGFRSGPDQTRNEIRNAFIEYTQEQFNSAYKLKYKLAKQQ